MNPELPGRTRFCTDLGQEPPGRADRKLGEVPFGRYYGSIDATPLFVALAGLYWQRTRDRATLEAILPNVRAALEWCFAQGDMAVPCEADLRRRRP